MSDVAPIAYSKPFKTPAEQLEILKSRGLMVRDETSAVDCLHRNGYYRLSAYWYPFRKIVGGVRTDEFLEDSHFEDARELYVFDKRFKLLLLDAIERIEIAARVEIAMCLGQRNIYAHLSASELRPSFTTPNEEGVSKHTEWCAKLENAIAVSKEEFVRHHHATYGSETQLPIWVAIELWDFGMLSKFFAGMQTDDQICVVNRFEVTRAKTMINWLHTINYVRNVIAHHGRLWNVNLAISPSPPKNDSMPDFTPVFSAPNAHTRIYSMCCILAHFTKIINHESQWCLHLAELLRSFPEMPHASLKDMGVPDD